jgi:protein O-GlcNAc transferase
MHSMNFQLQSMLQQAIKAFQSGNFDGADFILKRVLQVDSKNLPALHIIGLIKASQSNFGEAADYLARAARIHPNDASIQYNLAKALADSGNDKDALTHHKKAVALDPNNPEAWLSYGKTASNLARYEDALDCYNKALSLKTDYAEAVLNKAATLRELKRYEDAIASAERALTINPSMAAAWSTKGSVLRELKYYDEAIACYDKALSVNPDYAEGWSNKVAALHELKHYDEAIACYDKALSVNPDYAEGWSNKGAALHELKHYDKAIAHYDQAIKLKPDINWIHGDLLGTKMKICAWSDLQESLDEISKKLFASEMVTNPFPLLALTDNSLLHKQSSEIFIKSKYPSNTVLGPLLSRSNNPKIRVGYFSADFHNHATGYLMAELFELHDKSQFELVCFSFGPETNDEMRTRLKKSFDHFIEVGNKSDIEIAQLSRSLNIDIAVDLKGFTQDSRTGIFSYRAAPVQVSYLGYPGTMGAEYIDYIIADKILIPLDAQSRYTEQVIYLPNSYQVNDRKRVISDSIFTRQELGLPEHGFVFCCFNNNYKILPKTFASWIRILKSVDDSVLWLFQDNSWAVENLKKEAEKQGITLHRLVFAERAPLSEHLARHRQADLFLDTLPYNAHTAASDALWAGLPVLTLMGESFASRVAASLSNAIGLPELITSSQEEYEELAIELALNPKKLADIKLRLANNRLTAPLFDTPLFTKNLETAYIKMIERYQADLEPEYIFIN